MSNTELDAYKKSYKKSLDNQQEELKIAAGKVQYYTTAVKTITKVLELMTPIGPMLSQASLEIQRDAVLKLREKMSKDLDYLKSALSIAKSIHETKKSARDKVMAIEKANKPKTRPKKLKLVIQNKSDWQKDDCLRCGSPGSKLEAMYGSAVIRFCSRNSKDCMNYAVDLARKMGGNHV